VKLYEDITVGFLLQTEADILARIKEEEPELEEKDLRARYEERLKEELGEHRYKAYREEYENALNSYWSTILKTRDQLRLVFIKLENSYNALMQAERNIINAKKIIKERVKKSLEGFSEESRKNRVKELVEIEEKRLIDARNVAAINFVWSKSIATEVAKVLELTIPYEYRRIDDVPTLALINTRQHSMKEAQYAKENGGDKLGAGLEALEKSLYSRAEKSMKSANTSSWGGAFLKNTACMGVLGKLGKKAKIGVGGGIGGGLTLLAYFLVPKMMEWYNAPPHKTDLSQITNPAIVIDKKAPLEIEMALNHYIREGFNAKNVKEVNRFWRMYGDFKWADPELQARWEELKDDLHIDDLKMRWWARSRESNPEKFRKEAAEIIFFMRKVNTIQMENIQKHTKEFDAKADAALNPKKEELAPQKEVPAANPKKEALADTKKTPPQKEVPAPQKPPTNAPAKSPAQK